MKIGILTHQYINNYGAFLQAWALREAIAELFPNDEVQIIDYVNLKHFIINAGGWFRFYKNRESFKDWMEKIKLPRTFAKARNQEMVLSKRCFNAKQINALDFDCIIVGSDEVWNYKDTKGNAALKFGEGLTCKNLIAYAPSVGKTAADECVPEYVIHGIKKFKKISARDDLTEQLVCNITGTAPERVLDPTFLAEFPRAELAAKKKPYILFYYCENLPHNILNQIFSYAKEQGSKYVQSAIGDTYAQAQKDLLDGKRVLFSGTPCQIAGLKQYLKKDYENLLTVDIICHGVPSKRFFQSFMEDYGKKLGGTITEFYFRDKSKGQGMITRSVYKNKHGERQEKVITGNLLSYVNLFSRSFTYRKNCYSCPFASEKRVGDLTLGDFWGFHEEYPSYDEKQGLSNGKGVSCILVNTNQGKATLEQCEGQFVLMTSDFEKVARHNDQLHSPSKYSPKREQILELYQKEGYEAVDRYFHKNYKKDILKYTVSGMLPKGLKRNIKKMAGKIKNK